jgi:CheY-like chemotaxis protein
VDWPTVTLILGVLAILGVLIVGGTASVSKGKLEVNSDGFMHWLHKAKEEKGQILTAPVRPVNPRPTRRLLKLPRATIAWVDDKPLNNVFERRALASAGIFCDSYTWNDEALAALEWVKYDLVISDIGREGRSETGWDLLTRVKEKHADIPFVFYTMGITENLRSEAMAQGAAGITETPDALAQLVLDLVAKHT